MFYTLKELLSCIERNYIPTGMGKRGAVLFADRHGRTDDTYRLTVDLRIAETGERPISLVIAWCVGAEGGYAVRTYGIVDDAETVEFRAWYNVMRYSAQTEDSAKERKSRESAIASLLKEGLPSIHYGGGNVVPPSSTPSL